MTSFWGKAKWGEGRWTDLSEYNRKDWWNSSYLFRRRIKVTPSPFRAVEAGYPISVDLDYQAYLTLKKIRPDYLDLEVVHINRNYDFAPAVLERVPYKVIQNPDTLELRIVFNAVERIDSENLDYAIYYYNPTLSDSEPPLEFTESDYIISETPANYNFGLTFSRPNEDWKMGFSDVVNARLALSFYGRNALLKVEKGPDRGVLELRLDEESPILIDTYNQTYVDSIIYVTENLNVDDHMIRVRVTGDKSASSQGYGIQFSSFDYSFHVDNQLQIEEVEPSKRVVGSIIGA